MKETIADAQASQKALFSLLIGFMALGLFVGIAALGVISARAVVERRHGIGVLRAIGLSRGMVQLSFLAESSFIAVLGIGLGPVLGLVSSVSLIDELRVDEPEVEFVIPWLKVILISVAAYFFSLLTTFQPPARQPTSRLLKLSDTSSPGSFRSSRCRSHCRSRVLCVCGRPAPRRASPPDES